MPLKGEVSDAPQPRRFEASSGIDPDKLIEPAREFARGLADSAERLVNPDKLTRPFFTEYEERLDVVPGEGNEAVRFEGDRGESLCVPREDTEKGRLIANQLAEIGETGIPYRDALPDFKRVAKATVQIDDMTDRRLGPGGNFEQAYTKLAEQWNSEGREGSYDWTARDVQKWCSENRLTIHERADMRTCDFVPRVIHETFRHSGGCAECARRDRITTGGKFDD